VNPLTPTSEHDRLADRLRAAAGEATTSPDARRRIERRVVLRRRRAAGRRAAAAVAAVAAVTAAGVVAVRWDQPPTEVRTGATTEPGTTAAPFPGSERLVPSYLPEGYKVLSASMDRLPPFPAATGAPTRTVMPVYEQVFRPPGPPGTTAPVMRISIGLAAEADQSHWPHPDGPAKSAGPWSVNLTPPSENGRWAWFEDGPRLVLLTTRSAVRDEDVLAFIAAMRWDPAGSRYAAEHNPGGLVETLVMRPHPPRTADSVTFRMTLSSTSRALIHVDTRIGDEDGALEARGGVAGYEYRAVDIGGFPGVVSVSTDGTDVSLTVAWPDGSITDLDSRAFPASVAGQRDNSGMLPPEFMFTRVVEDELIAVARSLRPVDQATWDALPH
jgi:hypothetical protein